MKLTTPEALEAYAASLDSAADLQMQRVKELLDRAHRMRSRADASRTAADLMRDREKHHSGDAAV
jgi:hypothetical protein